MPEGPEVYRFTQQVRDVAKGQYVFNIALLGGRFAKRPMVGLDEFIKTVVMRDGTRVHDVVCKGKLQAWTFVNEWVLYVTFGMSGSWRLTKEPHSAAEVLVSGPERQSGGCDMVSLFFVDPRRFGTLKLVRGHDVLDKKLASLGHDIIASELDTLTGALNEAAASKKWCQRQVVELLMDQGVVSGIGNYIKAECLYTAGVSPTRLCGYVTRDEFRELAAAATNTALRSIVAGGNTVRTYSDVNGEAGTFASQLKVYGKAKDPQGRDVVRTETADGRTTWWVPGVQK